MSTLYLGKTLASAEAFAREQGETEIVTEFDLTSQLFSEYAEVFPDEVHTRNFPAQVKKARILNQGFKNKYSNHGAELPVLVAQNYKHRAGEALAPDDQWPLPSIVPYYYHCLWEEGDNGWKKVKDLSALPKEEEPCIEINIRSTHNNTGKTSIAAIIIDALVDSGVAGEIRCRDGDIGKFFEDNLEAQYSECRLNQQMVDDAIATMKQKGVRVVINDTNDPSLRRRSGHFTGSRAMDQGGFKRDEMACVAATDKKFDQEGGTFHIRFPNK